MGLRSSGVVACFDTCHEHFKSMGDLQVREQWVTLIVSISDLNTENRYKNTDFIVVTALKSCNVKCAMVPYDIACQYKKNWLKWHAKLSDNIWLSDGPTVHFALPIWHGDIHQVPCKTENLLSYQAGGTKGDGKCPECGWGALNPFL